MSKVSVGATGHVWGVNRMGQVFVRRGISGRQPLGQAWDPIEGELSNVAVGVHSVWGTDREEQLWCRTALGAGAKGSAWSRVEGQMRDISVGPTGHVWGVTSDGKLWRREGVSRQVPQGRAWRQVQGALGGDAGRRMAGVSAGACQV